VTASKQRLSAAERVIGVREALSVSGVTPGVYPGRDGSEVFRNGSTEALLHAHSRPSMRANPLDMAESHWP